MASLVIKLQNVRFCHIDTMPSKPMGEGIALGQRTLHSGENMSVPLGQDCQVLLNFLGPEALALLLSSAITASVRLPYTPQSIGGSRCQCSKKDPWKERWTYREAVK